MKNQAAKLLTGILLGSIFLAGCGKNEATQAAKESVETEKEGTGETEETESKEEKNSQNKKADSKSDSKSEGNSGDNSGSNSAGKSDGNSEGKSVNTADSTEKQSDSDSESDSESTEESTAESDTESEEELDKIGILLPEEGEDINSSLERTELKSRFSEAGYEPVLYFAENDEEKQISQIRELLQDEKLKALVVSPADSYGLTEVLSEASEASIPVFDYDNLIMDTDKLKYYVTFDTRAIGKEIGENIIKKEELDKVREAKESRTIEFLMGSPDDEAELFLFNGIKEALQEYIDDGTLICRSGKLTFDENGIMRESTDAAMKQLDEIIGGFYQQEQTPDIICTASDAFSLAVVDSLERKDLVPGTDQWPLITGVSADAEAVKGIAEGKIGLTVLMDRRDLAEALVTLVDTYLKGDDVEVSNYSQYDNGVKIIGTVTCDGKIIDEDNYQILVDNGFYLAEMIEPDATPTPAAISISPTPAEAKSGTESTASENRTVNSEASDAPEITTEEVSAVGTDKKR